MHVKPLVLPAAVSLVVAVIALALGQSRGGAVLTTSPAVAGGATPHLTIVNYAFAPTSLTVKAGSTITVTNSDSTAHTATGRSGGFDSGTLKPGQSGHFTIKQAGTYTYFFQFHASMTCTIKVPR